MNMLIEELERLSSNPFAWAIIGILALAVSYSVAEILRCPLLREDEIATPEQIADAKQTRRHIGPWFGVVMLTGALVTVTGLLMITHSVYPALALAAVVAGICIIQTEPQRQRIRDTRRLVIASQDMGQERVMDARLRLRSSYNAMAAMNVALLVCVVGGLLAF